MRITSAGIVDIGGTSGGSAGELLVVEGANSAGHRAARINNTSTTNGYSTLWMGSSNDGLIRGGSTAGAFTDQLLLLTSGSIPISFYTANTERMRIDSSGNLLVNTTSQVSQGKGNLAFDGSSHQGFNLQETVNQTSAGFMYFQYSTTVLGTITRATSTNAILYNTTSDIRLKENIKNSEPALEIVSNIKVRQYDWIGCENSHQEYGFIAQELAEVVSDVVTKGRTEEDTWAVDYGKLTPLLCKAIQEQQALIESLTTRLNALENK
jgi:hypothetical protein